MIRQQLIRCALMLALAGMPFSGMAANYYLDPARGDMGHEGSRTSPWGSLEAVLEADKEFRVGDVLHLRGGDHGEPVIRSKNSGKVTIRAAKGEEPVVSRLTIRGATHWQLEGLTIRPEPEGLGKGYSLVEIGSDASRITVTDCRLYTVTDATDWGAAEWDRHACSGIQIDGSDCLVRDNVLRNVNFGITVTGVRNRVIRNIIENFCGDGMRGLGDYGVFERNVVKNCYDVNDNHDDGFQSWSVGEEGVGSGVVRNLVLRGNRIINFEDPDQPLRGTLQGIGCFDGFFEGWVVENNLVLVDHWHGITLAGARDCRIVNNTVADLNATRPGPPWIRIANHKNGTPSSGNVVRNNASTAYAHENGVVEQEGSTTIEQSPEWFRDPKAREFRFKESDLPYVPAIIRRSGE